MDKYPILCELLYIISNFEKGRIRIDKIWRQRYINSLYKSIYIMEVIINVLRQNQLLTEKDKQLIYEFINNNTGIIFPSSGNIELLFKCGSNELFLYSCIDEKANHELIDLMSEILHECNNLLKAKPKKYKKKIMYLLMAFHNIPRVYLCTKNKTIFNIHILPASKEEAMEWSHHYIALCDNI